MALHCIQLDPALAMARGLADWLTSGDAILLLGPATSLARTGHPLITHWLRDDITLLALRDELGLHGIDEPHPAIVAVDYAGWVRLVIEHPQQLLWS